MVMLDVEISDLEERLAKLKAMAARAAASSPKEQSGVLDARWAGRDSFSVKEGAQIFGTSEWAIYEAIKKGEIPAVRVGRVVRLARHTIEKMLGA